MIPSKKNKRPSSELYTFTDNISLEAIQLLYETCFAMGNNSNRYIE